MYNYMMLKGVDLLDIQGIVGHSKVEIYIRSSDIPLKWNDIRTNADINELYEIATIWR